MKKTKLCLGVALMALAPSSQALIYSDWNYLLLEPIDEIVVTAPRLSDDEGGFWQYNMLMYMTSWLNSELDDVGLNTDFWVEVHQTPLWQDNCETAVAAWRYDCKQAITAAEIGCSTGIILIGGRILGALGYLTCASISANARDRCDTFQSPVPGCD